MSQRKRQTGLSLLEVLVVMFLLSIVLIPAVLALRTSIVGAEVHADVTTSHYRLTSRMEQLQSEPFATLEQAAIAAGDEQTPSSYSEAGGLPGRLVVYLARYDGDDADADNDPFTGGDDGILWIRVEAEGTVHALETLVIRGS